MNEQVLMWMQGWRTEGVEQFWLGVSGFGEASWLWLLTAVLFWMLGGGVGYRMAFSMTLAHGVGIGLKGIFKVPRPWVRWEGIEVGEAAMWGAYGYSFPSGHAACTAALWGGGAAGLDEALRNGEGRRGGLRVVVWVVAAAWILLMGASRLGLGVHAPTDVAWGLVVGLVSAVAMSALVRWILAGGAVRAWGVALGLGVAAAAFLTVIWWGEWMEGYEAGMRRDLTAAAAGLLGVATAMALERTFVRWDPKALAPGWRVVGMVLGVAALELWAENGYGLLVEQLGDSWGYAAHVAATPLLVFFVWPLLMQAFRKDAAAGK